MVAMKADIGGKKRGPKKGSKDKPRVGKKAAPKAMMPPAMGGGLMGLNMKKGRKSESKGSKPTGLQKFF